MREKASARYKVLLATCLLTFGSYYCFDMPSVLEDQLTHNVIGKTSFGGDHESVYYNLFYTVYAWTNMAMSLVAGILVDRWGLKPCVFLFLCFCLFGQALYALAPTLSSLEADTMYILMFVGRFIFGLGGGSITIAQNAISAYWFAGRELAMAFGCTLTISRLGSVVNFSLSTFLFNTFFRALHSGSADDVVFCKANSTLNPYPSNSSAAAGPAVLTNCRVALAATLWFGDGLILVSFFAAVYWLKMHALEQRDVEREENGEALASLPSLEQGLLSEENTDGTGHLQTKKAKKKARKRMRLSDIAKLPLTFWIVAVIICSFYNDVFPFMAIAKTYISNAKLAKQCDTLSTASAVSKCKDSLGTKAGTIQSIVYLMSAVVSPFLGRAVDYFGRRGWLAIFGTAIVVPCFILLASTDVTPVVPMLMLGAGYCICASVLWPSIQFLVEPQVVGTANGLATSIQMLGIGISNIVVGVLMDKNTNAKTNVVNYTPVLWFFTVMAIASVTLSVILKMIDSAGKKKLYRGKRDEVERTQSPTSPNIDWLTSPTAGVANVNQRVAQRNDI